MMGFDINLTGSEKKTQKIVKSTKVVCTKCSRNLGEMIETLPPLKNNTEIKHIYVCPCGGESFTVKVKHNAFFLSAENLTVTGSSDIASNKYKWTLETHNE